MIAAEQLAEKYAQQILNEMIQYIEQHPGDKNRQDDTSDSRTSNVVPFGRLGGYTEQQLLKIGEPISLKACQQMLYEIWQNKETYEYTIEAMAHLSRKENFLLGNMPFEQVIAMTRRDYPREMWELDNSTFAKLPEQK